MITKSVTVGSRTLEFETGRIARQAHGSVLLREGNTVILSTVTYDLGGREGLGFFPLTVDYKEYHSAAGRIPGGFLRREGRSSDREVLGSRLCDRSIRPLFPKAFQADTQVISTVLSFDAASDTPVLAMISAAAAVHISEIPFDGPLAAIRVGRLNGELVAFPAPSAMTNSDIDLTVSVSREGVVMIEGGASEVPDKDMVEAIEFAQVQLAPVLDVMDELRKEAGREKITLPDAPEATAWVATLEKNAKQEIISALAVPEKLERKAALKQAKQKVLEEMVAANPDEESLPGKGKEVLSDMEARLMREAIVHEKRRVDGRGPEDIRPIACEVGWLPTPHGSALFTRGETQAMVSLTLGSTQDRMLLDQLEGVSYDKFMLHYNFPAYSVGEVRPLRGPGRREVGHGALARRALLPVLPSDSDFPYTVRIVSEISESNGSSSMATVCGGALALMDGGVPISSPVAGIAMGLIKEGDDLVVLSDILGDEDHLGDMDFKVAGTENGVTAIQMDNKIGSLPAEVMGQAFDQARRGRLHILGEMAKAIQAPREEVKSNAPMVASFTIAAGRVRDLIGPGGKIIQGIQKETETRVEVDDAGQVRIYAPNREARDAAYAMIQDAAGSLEVGDIYDAVVTGVKEFGAFVRARSYEGLVHISEWDSAHVENMEAVAKIGDKVRVKVMGTDRQGRLTLSRKEAL